MGVAAWGERGSCKQQFGIFTPGRPAYAVAGRVGWLMAGRLSCFRLPVEIQGTQLNLSVRKKRNVFKFVPKIAGDTLMLKNRCWFFNLKFKFNWLSLFIFIFP